MSSSTLPIPPDAKEHPLDRLNSSLQSLLSMSTSIHESNSNIIKIFDAMSSEVELLGDQCSNRGCTNKDIEDLISNSVDDLDSIASARSGISTARSSARDGPPPEVKIDLKKGKLELSEDVVFAPNSSEVSHKSNSLLKEVYNVIKANRVRIRVEGHTSKGKNEGKLVELSEERAKSVMKALIRRGIPKKYLESKGYGSSRPPDDEKQTAKRVEFIVVGEVD